ncbi:MAG: ABC transporter substrate-binding protein [Thermoprotei archaeon]
MKKLAALLSSALVLMVALSSYSSAATSEGPTMYLSYVGPQRELAYMVSASLSSAGLTVIPENLSWPSVFNRVFYSGNLNYSSGGYDAFLLSEALPPSVNPFNPALSLIAGEVSSVSGNLSNYEKTGNLSYLRESLEDISRQYYEIPLFYARPLWALTSQIKGFDPTLSSYYPEPWLWSGPENLTFLQPGPSPSSVLPMFGSSGIPADAIFQPLIIPTDSGYLPCLATNWTQANSTTWLVYLRQGVRFQNGEPMTANDVIWSIKVVMDPLTGSVLLPLYESVLGQSAKLVLSNGTTYYTNGTPTSSKVVALNDHELEFVLGRPSAIFYPLFLSNLYVYPMGILARLPDSEIFSSSFSTGKAAIGTGPYRLVSESKGVYVLSSYSGYWNGSVRIPDIYVVFSQQTARQALDSVGKYKALIISYQFWLYPYYNSSLTGVSWSVGAPVIYVSLLLNLQNGAWGTGKDLPVSRINPFQSALYAAELRKAMQEVVPRGYLARVCFNDLAEPASLPVTPIEADFTGINLPVPAHHNWTDAQDLIRGLGYNVTISPIAFTIGPSYIYQGSSLTAYGYFLYNGTPMSRAYLNIMVGSPYRQLRQVVTTQEGTFNFTFYPSSGSYYFRAEYPGGLTPLGLIPPIESVTVGPVEVLNWWSENWIYVAVLVVFAALLGVLAFRYLTNKS